MSKRILWVTALNEIESDIAYAMKSLGYRFRILCANTSAKDYLFPLTLPNFCDIVYHNGIEELRQSLENHCKYWDADIIIKRAGWGTASTPYLVPNIARNHKIPCAIWTSEQGEERNWQYYIAKNYDWVWVNNKVDLEWYAERGIKKLSYFPFGCVPEFHRRVKPVEKYVTDIVCYSNPLYGFYQGKTWCVKNMILPLKQLKYKLSLWGTYYGNGWQCLNDTWIDRCYKGKFDYMDMPAVNSSCKMVMGASANMFQGGYGSKVARALGCRTFVMYPHTVGDEDEFEKNGKNLVFVEKKVLENVEYFMENDDEREKVAERGQRFAYKYLDYAKNFEKVLKEEA